MSRAAAAPRGTPASGPRPVAPEPPSDADLMARVRDGDTARLADLFERHHRRLYGFFLRLTGDRGAAEDLVQEVFVRMLKYRHTFKPGAELGPWIYALARNAAADHWRARPRELSRDPEAPEPAAELPHPLDGLERREQSARLAAALARLHPEKRELLLLARGGELRYDGIGELLGCSVGAVKLRVHRAMKDLRTAYQALAPGGPA
jgi:RNA polymerase sigma-70 factor (ECF subfamily)